jgi:hypothetical protein
MRAAFEVSSIRGIEIIKQHGGQAEGARWAAAESALLVADTFSPPCCKVRDAKFGAEEFTKRARIFIGTEISATRRSIALLNLRS